MDLILFAEWLAYKGHEEDDYGARITLNSIRHYCSLAGSKALKDNDLEEFKKFNLLARKISNLSDVYSLRVKQRREENA